MRRMRVLGSALGLLTLGTGCATSTGGAGSSQFSTTSVTRMTREQQIAWRDSTYAQAIADAEGPGANIRAEFSNLAGSRRVRGIFELDADAYVVIGHIDGEGILRIAFPLDPRNDDGFVKGHNTYQTHEFFAGFSDAYRYRAQTGFARTSGLSRYDSYDGGQGYLFIIASWRPMRFDRFQTEGKWDSFELADYEYMKDPRAAIYELASLLVGENREMYTVKLARYTSTQSLYGDAIAASDYGMFRYCAGYRPMGFAFNPFSGAGAVFNAPYADYGYGYGYGYTFTRRGTTYYYDRFGDCYRTGIQGIGPTFGNGYGYRIAGGPIDNTGGQNTPRRAFNPEGQRTPFTPRLTPASSAVVKGQLAESSTGSALPASPTYRQRGLITPDDPTTRPGRSQPRVENGAGIERRSRPSIQEMVNRQPTSYAGQNRASSPRSTSNNNNNSRSRAQGSDYSPADRRGSPSSYQPSDRASSSGSGYTPPSSTPTSSSSAPPPSAPPASGQSSGPPGSSSSGRPPGGTP